MDKIELYEKIVYGTETGIKGKHKLFPDLFDDVRRNEILNNPIQKEYLDELHRVTENYRKEEIKVLPWRLFKGFDTTGNRIEYEKVYFEHRGRLMSFALMSWLYRDSSDIEALEDIICAICEEYTWALPAHLNSKSLEPATESIYQEGRLLQLGFNPETYIDLFAAETAFALSEILYMLEEYLASVVVHRARKEIYRRVLFSYLNYPGIFPWETMKNNWCAVCAGSIGITGIYLLEDDKALARLLDRLNPTLERFLKSFEEDGACLEGLSYWTYGVSFYVAYADLLKMRTAGEVDILKTEQFEKIAMFQQKCYFPGGLTVSFSDANTKDYYRSGLTSYLKKQFRKVQVPPRSSKAGYLFDPCYRWCHGIRDLLWTEDDLEESSTATICDILPEAQWLLCKQYSGQRLGLAVKGGHNGEPHNHNDVGSFIFYKDGECFLTDLGSGEYTKDYFGDKRYSIFCNHSISHNVPMINGKGQMEGESFAARDVVYYGNNRMAMDISGAYGNRGLIKLIRDITFREDKISLTDTFKITNEIKYINERLVSLHRPIIMKDYVVLQGEGTECVIRYHGYKGNPQIQLHSHRDHEGNEVTVYSINFEATTDSDIIIYNFEFQ